MVNILKFVLKKFIPRKFHFRVRRIYSNMVFGCFFKNRVFCPCCNRIYPKFLPFGLKPRPNAMCPGCGSKERHRLLQFYLENQTNFFKDRLKVLDVAPMRFFQDQCKVLPNLKYFSVDIHRSFAMLKVDITNIPIYDDYFDCILCYHVLEHIPDDQKAMKELFRVLKRGGWAIINSPIDISRDKTFENANIILPEEREKVFGQKDHVRIYGKDYKDRLEKAGFVVRVDNYAHELADSLTRKYGLMRNGMIYFCSKPK